MTSNQKKLLIEAILPTRKPVVSESDEKFMYLNGLFIQGAVKNHNGRIYPAEEISRAVDYINQRIKEHGPVAGELDHPEGMNINFDRVSHCITEMRMVGNDGHGRIRIMNQGLGLIAKGTAEMGVNIGVSSRGLGNVDNLGEVSEFDIVTIDLVINPSAPNAYPKLTLGESVGQSGFGIEMLSLTEACRHDKTAQKFLQKEIHKFLMEVRDQVSWRKS